MNKLIPIFLFLAAIGGVQAQSVPTPAPAQSKAILLENGTIHIGNGEVVEKGGVLFENGKIVQAGVIRGRLANVETIDLQGQHVYPGIIAPATQIGLDEIEAVRATDDRSETGAINPNARAIIGYNTDSRVTPTIRSNGVLMAQVAPSGGLFQGSSSIVQLDAWNWTDAAVVVDDAVHLNWPRLAVYTAWWAPPVEEQKKRSMEYLAKIDQAMDEAKAYMAAKESGRPYDKDLRWEALGPVLKREKPLFIHANTEKEIRSALSFALKYELRWVLVEGADSWRVTEELKKYEVPVVLAKPQRLPRLEDEDIDQPYKTPKLLQDAGVLFCLSMNDFWNQRNLPFQAGTAAAYGLTKEEALASITLSTAKILGIDSTAGSLEPGKDATIVVSQGDLLDMRSSQVTRAYIQGRAIDLGNKQKDLYEKFKGKYEGKP